MVNIKNMIQPQLLCSILYIKHFYFRQYGIAYPCHGFNLLPYFEPTEACVLKFYFSHHTKRNTSNQLYKIYIAVD